MELPTICVGDVLVYPTLHRIVRGKQEVLLEPRVMSILLRLIEGGGAVVSRKELIASAWPEGFGTDEGLTKAISILRGALGDTAADARVISTIRKRGYRISAPIDANVDKKPSATARGRISTPKGSERSPRSGVVPALLAGGRRRFAVVATVISVCGVAFMLGSRNASVLESDPAEPFSRSLTLFADTLDYDKVQASVDSLLEILDLPDSTKVVVRARLDDPRVTK